MQKFVENVIKSDKWVVYEHYKTHGLIYNFAYCMTQNAVTSFSTHDLFLNRTVVEESLFHVVRQRLGGICCSENCDTKPYGENFLYSNIKLETHVLLIKCSLPELNETAAIRFDNILKKMQKKIQCMHSENKHNTCIQD